MLQGFMFCKEDSSSACPGFPKVPVFLSNHET